MTVHVTSVRDAIAANVDAIPVSSPARRGGIYRNGLKRTFDVLCVLVTMPFVLPFALVVAALISLDGHTPIFRQERVGKDGKRFTMWKFRTMVPDAEQRLELHLSADASARDEWNTKQKLSCDPRCTRIGRALRRTSIDELPQLYNVLMGDMSLVGPRPMMPAQQSLYPGRAYYFLRPGMTGSWQVSRRNASEFSARAGFDDSYDASLSFATDIAILLRTVTVVLRGTGC